MATLTAAQARARVSRGGSPIDSSEFDDTWVDEVIAEHDATFTRYRGEIPDSATETETVRPVVGVSDRLLLRYPKPTAITSVTVDGTTLSSTGYYLENGMLVRKSASWVANTVVVVVYPHGFGSPAALKRACALYVEKTAMMDRGGSSRDVRASGEFTSFVQPDWSAGRPTGWADVDRIWNSFPDLRMPGIG
jgi:hypothetical protein